MNASIESPINNVNKQREGIEGGSCPPSYDKQLDKELGIKPMSIAEFKEIADRDDWHREQEHEVVDRDLKSRSYDENDSSDLTVIYHLSGWACKTSTLNDITITYIEGFDYDEYEPDSLATDSGGYDEVWTVEGISVVDEYGDELGAHDLEDYLPSEFSSIDYSVLKIEQVTNIHVNEESELETYTLDVDNAPSLRFTGKLIASVFSSDNNASGSYSGQTGRCEELDLYKTKGGKFICHQIDRTCWQGERDSYRAKVCEAPAGVKEFFGHSWLAKELYESAGIDDVVEVE